MAVGMIIVSAVHLGKGKKNAALHRIFSFVHLISGLMKADNIIQQIESQFVLLRRQGYKNKCPCLIHLAILEISLHIYVICIDSYRILAHIHAK